MAKQDRIIFALTAEDTVVNDTVKIVAHIAVGGVTHDIDETHLRTSIRDMLGRFIKAQWQFAQMNRAGDDSGLEKITLIASARVPEAENRALDQRRQDASLPNKGLRISKVTTDLTFPASLIEETEKRLRIEIIRKARAECNALSTAMERPYRIAKIEYDPQQTDTGYSNSRSQAMMSVSAYGSGFSPEGGADDAIGNAQKRTMMATVTLANDVTDRKK